MSRLALGMPKLVSYLYLGRRTYVTRLDEVAMLTNKYWFGRVASEEYRMVCVIH